jgi:hypothetical protein
MRTAARAVQCSLVVGLLVASSPRAHALDAPGVAAHEPDDDDLIAVGVALRKQGRDEEALAAFERAYALRASARAVAQIALAHQAMAHWLEAERGFEQALAAEADPWIARNRVYLEESLVGVRAHLGWLEVEADVEGAEAWSGAQLLGRLPLASPVRLVAGDLTIEVRAPGRAAIQRTLRVEGNATVHAAFVFAAPPVAPQAAPRTVAAASPRAERSSPWTTSAGWIAAGAAGGLALAGIAGLVTREWEAQIYDDDSRCGPLPGVTRYQRCGTNRDIGSAAQTVAIVAFSGAGVAAVVSGVLLLRAPPQARSAKGFGCVLAGPGLLCSSPF